jgi:hypothetical protein
MGPPMKVGSKMHCFHSVAETSHLFLPRCVSLGLYFVVQFLVMCIQMASIKLLDLVTRRVDLLLNFALVQVLVIYLKMAFNQASGSY